ncbi:MAG TPA: SAM-dependent methyltransferase [Pseudonocardiaceae bacterium]|nr:SAM-dependent methyltransferase [Pseudonocardiaceae bacterium]
MTKNPGWVPQGVDMTVPNAARVYDYFLDGAHNFAIDREMASKIQKLMPTVRDAARINRSFLRRAVLFMVDSGIRQFLDIGSGIPTVGNVHEIVQRADPECRVLYVDKESVAVRHSELILERNDRAAVIQANLRDVEGILDHPQTKRMLDFDQPIGLLMLALLHFVPDSSGPVGILARYRDRLAPGSYLALTHVTADNDPTGLIETTQLYQNTPEPLHPRSYEEVVRLFAGFELVKPGVVGSALWRTAGLGDISDKPKANTLTYGGVGRKP